MSTPDNNLVSFAGYDDGRIELFDQRFDPPLGRELRSAGSWEHLDYRIEGEVDADPSIHSDAIKFSNAVNLTVRVGVVKGGKEDVWDCNRLSKNCHLLIEDAYPRGRFVSTIKGESDGVTITIARLHGHGKEVDFDLGNNAPANEHTPTLNGDTKNVAISIGQCDDEATVRCLRYKGSPTLRGGPFRYVFPCPKPKWLHDVFMCALDIIQ